MDGIDNPPFLQRVSSRTSIERVSRRDLLRPAPGRQDLGDDLRRPSLHDRRRRDARQRARLRSRATADPSSRRAGSSGSSSSSTFEILIMYARHRGRSAARRRAARSRCASRGRARPERRSTSSARRTCPFENLDPALTRPGRMGRHITFRTPTKDDRKDIFDLYLAKVAHDPDLDTPERRDEIARITTGYSPAMIDQICSMALTNAHHEGQAAFTLAAPRRLDDRDRVGHRRSTSTTTTTDARAVAIHEAGHAAAAHVYAPRSSRAGSRSRCAAAASATTSPSRRRSASAPSRAGCSAS